MTFHDAPASWRALMRRYTRPGSGRSVAESRPRGAGRRRGQSAVVVVLGIDGSGKTTAAGALKDSFPPGEVLVLGNYSGRKTIAGWGVRYRVGVPVRIADALETAIRVSNVLINHLRARRFEGLVIMDRHLYCQVALRTARGIGPGTALPALMGLLPEAYAVVYFDLPAEQAYERIRLRGEDQETINGLRSFQAGYRELPGYPGFRAIDASGPRESTLLQLKDIVTQVMHGDAVIQPELLEA